MSSIYFLDAVNGDDTYDGKQSALYSAPGPLPWYTLDGGLSGALESSIPGRFTGATGKYLHILADVNEWWIGPVGIDADASRVFGEVIHANGTAHIIDQPAAELGGVGSNGPVKTLAHLLTLVSPGDYAYQVQPSGHLTQVYPVHDPLIESIALAIKARLETITVGNGYAFDIGTICRPQRINTPPPEHLDVILQQGTRRRPEDPACNVDDWIQPFLLDLVIRDSDESTTPADATLNMFVAAVEAALMGSDAWHITGLIDKDLAGPEPLPEGVAYDGVRLTLEVYYRTALGDPYTGV